MYLWYRYASLANPNAWIVLLVRTKCSSVSGMCLDMILQLPCVFKRLTIPSAVTIAPHPSPRGIIHPSIHPPLHVPSHLYSMVGSQSCSSNTPVLYSTLFPPMGVVVVVCTERHLYFLPPCMPCICGTSSSHLRSYLVVHVCMYVCVCVCVQTYNAPARSEEAGTAVPRAVRSFSSSQAMSPRWQCDARVDEPCRRNKVADEPDTFLAT